MDVLQKINVLYEDNHLLVVEKPVNVPVCEDNSLDMDFLNLLKLYIKNKYNKPGNVYLGLVHRLDRPVGGVMVFAKTSKAASRLSEQVRSNKLEKKYYAVVEGKIIENGNLIDYLVKDHKRNMSFVTNKDKGKLAKLSYKVIGYDRIKNFSLIDIKLETGRSHQIRVQFSSRGFPLVGDAKYNVNFNRKVDVALFSYKLSFYHPITKERLSFELDMQKKYPFNLF